MVTSQDMNSVFSVELPLFNPAYNDLSHPYTFVEMNFDMTKYLSYYQDGIFYVNPNKSYDIWNFTILQLVWIK